MERLISEVLIFVKLLLSIYNKIFDARVTSIGHVCFGVFETT